MGRPKRKSNGYERKRINLSFDMGDREEALAYEILSKLSKSRQATQYVVTLMFRKPAQNGEQTTENAPLPMIQFIDKKRPQEYPSEKSQDDLRAADTMPQNGASEYYRDQGKDVHLMMGSAPDMAKGDSTAANQTGTSANNEELDDVMSVFGF